MMATQVVQNVEMEEIRQYAKALRLSNLRGNCSDIIHKAQINKPTFLAYTRDVLKDEVETRQRNDLLRRMRQAKLPKNCDLDRFDFNHSAGITKSQLQQMRELVWLDQLYNLIFMGPSGTGKTFMTAGLIRDAVMHGYKALFMTMESLVNILRLKDISSSAMNAYNGILRCNLIGIDDIMLMPMKKEEAVAFFNLINNLHEKASIIITTNKAPTEWVEILQDEVLAQALLDRLLYRCDVVKLVGSSYRMENRSGFLTKEEGAL
ncbi:MAG: insertion sequence IS21-like ATP-binding protein [bacterium F082]|nr:MAG: insertion sequence IS21-like ATP-binding protein [bacterium F082]